MTKRTADDEVKYQQRVVDIYRHALQKENAKLVAQGNAYREAYERLANAMEALRQLEEASESLHPDPAEKYYPGSISTAHESVKLLKERIGKQQFKFKDPGRV